MRAQLLTGERPTGLVDLVRHLTVVRLDPTTTVAPSAGREPALLRAEMTA